MGEVRPIPTLGGVFRDARGQGRALRVSWHAEDGLVVLSLWDGGRCTGTVRVVAADVPALLEALGSGLPAAAPPGPAPALLAPVQPAPAPARAAGPGPAPVDPAPARAAGPGPAPVDPAPAGAAEPGAPAAATEGPVEPGPATQRRRAVPATEGPAEPGRSP